jgi:serine/threonine protein kinase
MLKYKEMKLKLPVPLGLEAPYFAKVKQTYEDTHEQEVKGVAGFQLFLAEADNSTEDSIKACNQYLKNPDVLTFIFGADGYDIPATLSSQLSVLQFHKSGTTSYILRSRNNAYALKLIKPRFSTVDNIRTSTQHYKENFGDLGSFAPKVHGVGSLWVLMDFCRGLNLTDFNRQYLYTSPSSAMTDVQLDLIEKIINKVSAALHDCAANYNINHLDLSPDNIIVKHSDGQVEDIYLIDFGVNYLLQEHVGSVGGLARAQIYIAPELQLNDACGTVRSDVYSLGMILLEMLSGRLLEKETLGEDLNAAWLTYPELAEVVEDLIDKDPANRLIAITPQEQKSSPTSPEVFNFIDQQVKDSINLHKLLSEETRHPLLIIFETMTSFIPLESIRQLWRKWRNVPNIKQQGTQNTALLRRLLYWGVLVQALNILAICCFVWFALYMYEQRFCSAGGYCLESLKYIKLPKWDGALWGRVNGSLPGRLVALSFSIVLAKYYLDIFSSLSLPRIKVPHSPPRSMTELFLRIHPLLGVPAILYAIIFDPKAWPFCSAFGLAAVCINNRLMYGMATSSAKLIANSFSQPASTFIKREVKDYGQWWVGILIYLTAIALVGLLLLAGFAKDEWLYASLVVICNIVVMYRFHCSLKAPDIRTMFRRLLSGLRRIEKKRILVAAQNERTAPSPDREFVV